MAGIAGIGPNRESEPVALEPLWRHVLGRKLRMLRLGQNQKLAETASRAGISPQYLSEIERGLKEPSSEMIAAVAGALGITLLDLTVELANDFRDIAAATPSNRATNPFGSGSTLLLAA